MNQILLDTLYTAIGTVVTFVLSMVGYKLTMYINAKVKNEKTAALLSAATQAVTNAVKAANQTYVDAIKKTGTFDATAQRMAFETALEMAEQSITAEMKEIIESVYGDFNYWITTAIEAAVADAKA